MSSDCIFKTCNGGHFCGVLGNSVGHGVLIIIIITVPGNIAQSLSTDQTCEVGAVTEGSIPGTDKKPLIALICKTYQREIKLFEFSQDTNRAE